MMNLLQQKPDICQLYKVTGGQCYDTCRLVGYFPASKQSNLKLFYL